MNLRALFHNWTKAKTFCRGNIDRVKYVYWLYSKSLPFSAKRSLNLRVKFGPPVRDAELTVRCNGGSDAFIFSEVFEHRYYDFDLPAAPQTILDAGANAGFTALFFSRKYPDARLACVEPMPVNVRILQTNIAQNRLSAKVVPKALCIDDRPVIMQIASDDYGHKVADAASSSTTDDGKIEVAGISVPTLMAEMGWERIDLLKIDIEGYENVLLRENCQWLGKVDAVCIELHEGFGEEDLRAVAARFGFAPPTYLAGTWLMVRRTDSARVVDRTDK